MSAPRLVAVLAAAVLGVTVVAAAVGKPTLSVSPDPVTLGETFTVAGCGYPVGSSISFEVDGPRKSGIHYFTAGTPVDAGGCYEAGWLAWWGVSGAYQLTSWYRDGKGATHKAAVVKFSVVE